MAALPFCVVPHALGTVAAGNELASNPASHLGEFDTIGMTWKSSGNSNLWVRGDFGVARRVDFMSMLLAEALPGTTIRLRLGDSQAEVDGTADYDSGALAFISPAITRTDGLYHSHLELPSVQTKRWWRIDIGGHTGDFEAAGLVLGERITPANFYNPGWSMGVDDLGELDVSRYGVADETPGRIFRTLDFRLGWLSESDFETKMRPLVETLGRRRPALWCFDPTANAYRQARTYFGWLRNPPVATHSVNTPEGARFEQEFQVLSMV